MKLIKKINGLNGFYLYDGVEVFVYEKYFTVGGTHYKKEGKEHVFVQNGVLKKNNENECCIIQGNDFVKVNTKISLPTFMTKSVWIEYNDNENRGVDIRFIENGEEYIFNVQVIYGIHWPKYDARNAIFLFSEYNEKRILAYKMGHNLWEYTEQEENLKINGRCIPIVDDVVVIISCNITIALKVQGFNIRTGEQLWILDVSECVCPNTFFVGDDKMLYGCDCYYGDTTDLHLCKLDPFTGKLESWNVLTDEGLNVCPWNVALHGNLIYYTNNRWECKIGVIDIDKKQLIDFFSLNIKKGCQTGAPIITDDNVYVFIDELQELRVYEK